MVGYDFAKTIYRGDSTTDFFFFMLKKRPYLLFLAPYFLCVFALYGLRVLSKKRLKECLFFYIPRQKNIDHLVDLFWQSHANKIKDWFCVQREPDDVIVSASLEFILLPILSTLGLKNCIATKFDVFTGKILGENCFGKEKVSRFKDRFGDIKLDAFYSDSTSDLPMMKISNKAYLVSGDRISEMEM